MNKIVGVQGKIVGFPFDDLQETIYDRDGITIYIKGGILSIAVESKDKIEEAKELAHLYLAHWSLREGIKISVEFNSGWEIKSNGTMNHFIEASDSIKLVDRVIIQEIKHTENMRGKSRIVTQLMHDSASFSNDNEIVKKALKHPALKDAIFYYNEEVIDSERPLYGIYKAIEAMIGYLGSKEKLASLVGQPSSYIKEIMQTAQPTRHHETPATIVISDDECRQRIKILIKAFANFLS